MDSMVSVALTYDEKSGQWGAWLPDIAAYGSGSTPQEAMVDLRRALALYREEVGQEKMMGEIAPPTQSLSVPLESLV
ncbi:hypothetical protein A3C37_02730 [Candidatus Peribacteria bacterium RIFCSPHIGHO2_02_FULL_53_20]|nr:MAG: hypothetical protein A3C37_02730 [Candidatus Peribacteria bacterium RIFCSPHIGHO2_02_FULL_53_20]OGJ68113.1 MAG: hypothetical protein A3B61_02415 [Candidatus Peribacteria bacterium RIFCSPLOWO2_01_FULL_53_10]OGJ70048.1 MAG: hypothetical protein A3G69_02790 [Candidatus Peribacteria bacterium RIFCSPLOWO2_12_FULL_53_10]